MSHDDALQIAPGLTWSVPRPGKLRGQLGDRTLSLPWRALSILAALEQPQSFSQLVARLGPTSTGAVDWIALTGLIKQLIDLGVLVSDRAPASSQGSKPPRPQGREIEMHIELLDDEARTQAYLAAIRANVRPGDVVVDLGTGNAVLAMAAARAGASRVWAIEASTFAEVAEQIIRANGLADRITVLRGWSNQIELPERADVLVSEIIGNDPMDEGVLRYVPDAVRRFLKPGGRILPNRIAVELQVLAMPEAERLKHRIPEARLQRWQAAYGMDYRPFASYAAATTRRTHHLASELERWAALSPAYPLLAMDFSDVLSAEQTRTLEIDAEPHPAAALVVRTLVQMPGCDQPLLCGGHWRWPVRLLPEAPGNGRWQVTAKWGALKSGLELECMARPAD
jgi:precorrin-6B methylase 2